MAPTRPSRRDRGAVPLAVALVVLAGAVGGVGVGLGVRTLLDDGGPTPIAAASGSSAATRTLTAHDCPEGEQLGTLRSGDRVFVTARSAEVDGWLRVRDPLDSSVAWWVDATGVTPDTEVADLPEVDCDSPLLALVADAGAVEEEAALEETPEDDVPEEDVPEDEVTEEDAAAASTTSSTTSTSTTTTTRPTTTTTRPTTTTTTQPTTTTTTAPPDTSGPTVSLTRSAATIDEVADGLNCPNPSTSTVTVSASDPSGVTSVVMGWSGAASGSATFATSGSRTFGPFAYTAGAPQGGSATINVSVTATDQAGNQTIRGTSITVRSADLCFQ
ncbi:MAG TPA: hypothetical protein VK866_11445 [Acidimicrobiales bacterium]|nr:hypothetical protein [Acidimicrobiales bacterium]